MEKEEVSAGEYIKIGGITLVPILRTAIVCLGVRKGITGFGTREVVGLVVVSPTGNHAISISGEEVPVDDYTSRVPEVKELLQQEF